MRLIESAPTQSSEVEWDGDDELREGEIRIVKFGDKSSGQWLRAPVYEAILERMDNFSGERIFVSQGDEYAVERSFPQTVKAGCSSS